MLIIAELCIHHGNHKVIFREKYFQYKDGVGDFNNRFK